MDDVQSGMTGRTEINVTPTPTTVPTATPTEAFTATPILLQPTDTPAPSEATAPTPSPEQSRRVEGRVTAFALNVRTGPGMAYPIVGGLSLGDSVEVVGRSAAGPSIDSGRSDWLQIVYPSGSDGRGWIAAAYADPVQDEGERMEAVPEVSTPPLTPKQACP
jgi:hypothetical protein